jgi:uncharacterized membrane protein
LERNGAGIEAAQTVSNGPNAISSLDESRHWPAAEDRGKTMQNASARQIYFNMLEPHPRWRWRIYSLRWLIGGGWSLLRLPLRGSLFGLVVFAVVSSWVLALRAPSGAGFALATSLTGLTLLLAPRLTMGLLDVATRPARLSAEDAERREGALIGLGSLLVLILSIALNSAMVAFALLYSGDVPRLDRLLPAIFSLQNAPLALSLSGLTFIAGLSLQLFAVLPTFVLLQQTEVDLFAAVRAAMDAVWLNWRPLAWWSLTSQLLLFAGFSLLPVSLVLLAPLIACGSWWACREMAGRRREVSL